VLVLRSHSIVVNARGVSRHVVGATRAWSNYVSQSEREKGRERKGKGKGKSRKERNERERREERDKMRREKKSEIF